MWRRKHNPQSLVGLRCRLLAPPSSHHASGASRPSPRSSLRLSARPACLPHTPMRSSSARLSLGGLLSSRRLIGSPLASYRPAPRSIRQARRGGTIGERLLAGGHRRCADGGGRRAAVACLPRGDGRSGSIVPRSFLFSHHRLIQPARPRLLSSSHRPISSTGRSLLFLFA